MNNRPKIYRRTALVALILGLLALCVIVIVLLVIDPPIVHSAYGAAWHFFVDSDPLLFVTSLPIVRTYIHLWSMYLVFCVLLATIIYYEVTQKIIPDAVTIPGIVIGLGFVLGFRHVSPIDALLGVLPVFWIYGAVNAIWLRTRGKVGMGAGDVKMMAMIGAFLGSMNLIIVLMLASILALIYAAKFRRRPFSENIEFGPWLAIAALFCAFVHISRHIWGN